MKKPLPCQQKVLFFVPKGETILKNALRETIFPGVENERPEQSEDL